jgi:hypothetical protein
MFLIDEDVLALDAPGRQFWEKRTWSISHASDPGLERQRASLHGRFDA